jgi:hypothetical protein
MGERARRWGIGAAIVASYLLVACVIVGPQALRENGEVTGIGVDLPGTLWIHWWIRTTVEHLQLPITTNLLFYPDGKNFFTDTGANYIDAWLGVPLQWIFGVPNFLDALQLLILLGNGLAMWALGQELTGRRAPWAAWAAGVAFEICPFVVMQVGEGRPTQALLWFGVLGTRHLLRLRQGRWRDGLLFGLFVALQALTYWYMAYFLVFALFFLALRELRAAPRVVALQLAVAIAVTLSLTAPFLIGIHDALAGGEVLRTGWASWSESPAAEPTRWALTQSSFTSASALATLALGLFDWRRTWPYLLGIALCCLVAFGAVLEIGGVEIHNPLYIFCWEHLPLFSRLGFPERVHAGTFQLMAMVLALGLSRLDLVWAALAGPVFVAEMLWRTMVPVGTTACGIPSGNDRIREEGGAVIYLPFRANEDAMIYQTRHGQPIFGGMGEREPDLRPAGYSARLQNDFIRMLAGTLNDTEPPVAYTLADRQAIEAQFRWVWFDRRYAPPAWSALGYDLEGKYQRLVSELGEPVVSDPNYALFDLRHPVPADAPGLGPTAVRNPEAWTRLEDAQLAPQDMRVGGGLEKPVLSSGDKTGK